MREISDLAMDEIKKTETYFKNEDLLIFLSKYEKLLLTKQNRRHYSYWGINFKNEKVYSIKFYVHLMDEIKGEEMLDFVPSSDDFEQYIHLKDHRPEFNITNVGTILELKFIVGQDTPRYGFAYMLKDIRQGIDLLGFPEGLPSDFEEKCISLGVNFEYHGESKLFKKYYFFKPEDCRLFFEDKFNTSIMADSNLIEFSESDNFSKINVFGAAPINSNNESKSFIAAEVDVIQYFNEKYDCVNPEYGIYDHGEIKSVYFFDSVIKGNSALKNVMTLNKIVHG